MSEEHKTDWYEDVGHGRVHIFCDCEVCKAKRWLDDIARPEFEAPGVYVREIDYVEIECVGGGGSGGSGK